MDLEIDALNAAGDLMTEANIECLSWGKPKLGIK